MDVDNRTPSSNHKKFKIQTIGIATVVSRDHDQIDSFSCEKFTMMMFAKLTYMAIVLLQHATGSSGLTPISRGVRYRKPSTKARRGNEIHTQQQQPSLRKNLSDSTSEDGRNRITTVNTLGTTYLQSQPKNVMHKDDNFNTLSDKTILAISAIGYLASIIALSKLNLLGSDFDASLVYNFVVTIITTVLSLIFVKAITKLSAEGILQPRDSRKIIHTFSAPLFMLLWPFFTHDWGARLFAAFVPFLQAVRLWLAGTRSIDENELANAISRSGDKEEALGGPFIYVVILFASISLFFCDNLTGVIALCTMAAGDGMADIVGRRFGKNNKWFFSESKSIAGTLGFIASAAACSITIASWLLYTNTITMAIPFSALVARILFISTISSMVELMPFADDNWTVPITAGVLASILIPSI